MEKTEGGCNVRGNVYTVAVGVKMSQWLKENSLSLTTVCVCKEEILIVRKPDQHALDSSVHYIILIITVIYWPSSHSGLNSFKLCMRNGTADLSISY